MIEVAKYPQWIVLETNPTAAIEMVMDRYNLYHLINNLCLEPPNEQGWQTFRRPSEIGAHAAGYPIERYDNDAVGIVGLANTVSWGITYPTGEEGTGLPERGAYFEPPEANEAVILRLGNSICGTDITWAKLLKEGKLLPEVAQMIIGHEGAGIVVAMGKDILAKGQTKIGDIVCLESHFAPEGMTLEEAIAIRRDGIVAGIRPDSDGIRKHGYFAELIYADESSLTPPIPAQLVDRAKALSVFESYGNIYEIILQLRNDGLLEDPTKTALLVTGIGATGYTLAAVAHHYGFQVIGIEPIASKRKLAEEISGIRAFVTAQEANEYLITQLQSDKVNKVINAVMTGDQVALKEAIDLLKLIQAQKKECVVFGLAPDPQAIMPYYSQIPEHDFVFKRLGFTIDSVDIVGVCGRSPEAWTTMYKDLVDKPYLVDDLNRGVRVVNMKDFYQVLLTGDASPLLEVETKSFVKLAIRLIPQGVIAVRNGYFLTFSGEEIPFSDYQPQI